MPVINAGFSVIKCNGGRMTDMKNEILDETLKRAIIRKTIKSGYDRDGTLIKYGGRWYWVNIIEDRVVLQLEVK